MPKLIGGSMKDGQNIKIGFLNANGMPSGSKNLSKHTIIRQFMEKN